MDQVVLICELGSAHTFTEHELRCRTCMLCGHDVLLTGMAPVQGVVPTYPMMLHRMGMMARGMKACRMVDTTFLCCRQQQQA